MRITNLTSDTGKLFNFSTFNSSFLTSNTPITVNDFFDLKTNSYIPIAGCLLHHIITTSEFTNLAKLFYLLTNGLELINKQTNGERNYALPATTWAKILNCSKSQIFKIQKFLESKGYLTITKCKNSLGQNKRNLLTTTLPNEIFQELCQSQDRMGEHLPYQPLLESKNSYLDRTKLFIPINYQLLTIITSSVELSSKQKMTWLDLYATWHKSRLSKGCAFDGSIKFSYAELSQRYNLKVPAISKILNGLKKNNFILKERTFQKSNSLIEDRKDKCLIRIIISIPECYLAKLKNVKNRKRGSYFSNQQTNISNTTQFLKTESNLPVDLPVDLHSKVSYCDPHVSKNSQYINKDFKVNTNKNRYLAAPKSNFLGNNSIENLVNSPINAKALSCLEKKLKQLNDFYPLSPEDNGKLQVLSGRNFNLNSMNEILLSLAKKLKRYFKGKRSFMAYMAKVLMFEKRLESNINNETFRINSNLTDEEKAVQMQEKYLAAVEYDLNTSPELHLKKKLAAVLERNTAYNFLRAYSHSHLDGQTFKIYLNKKVELTAGEERIILNQVQATQQRINMESLEAELVKNIEITISKEHCFYDGTYLEASSNPSGSVTAVHYEGIWGRVRQQLSRQFGDFLDRNWLSKLTAEVDENKREVKLLSPTKFVKDWIEDNYGSQVKSLFHEEKYSLEMK